MAKLADISIRTVERPDLHLLRTIARATFTEAFSARNSASDMNNYLAVSFSPEKLTAEFENPGSLFFFAEAGPEVAGYLKINWGAAQTEALLNNALEIERIYVLSGYQGRGIGKALFEKACSIAREKEMDAIWLGVWEKNTAALQFYRKHGFVEFDKHLFRLGEDEQTDLLMKLEI